MTGRRVGRARGEREVSPRSGRDLDVRQLPRGGIARERPRPHDLAARLGRPEVRLLFMSGYDDERGNILPEVPLLAKLFAQRDLAHALRQVLRSIETN